MSIHGETKKLLKKIKGLFVEEITPPDYSYKRNEILRYAQKYSTKVFVETGTYKGETPDTLKDYFETLYTIELSKELYELAKNRFAGTNVNALHGNSKDVLPHLLKSISTPILFWLDGHYSDAPLCAKGDKDTPIIEELQSIFSSSTLSHVILIDDARLFGKDRDYPSLKQLQQFVDAHRPKWHFSVENDIIRIVP